MTIYLDLLHRTRDLSSLIDPTVSCVVRSLANQVCDLDMAGACLGTSTETIGQLVSHGILPGGLTTEEQDRLRAWLHLSDDEDLKAAILAHKERVAEFLGLPPPAEAQDFALPAQVVPQYPLFPHQRRALEAIWHRIRHGSARVLLHMPTGGGKTRTAMNLCCDTLRYSSRGAVIWIASTKELLEQAAFEFAKAWGFLGNREVQIHTAWGSRPWSIDAIQDGILIASPQTLFSHLKGEGPQAIGKLGRKIQLIVFDEAHQAIAPTYRNVVERLSAAGQPVTPIVGLSATPGRTFFGTEDDEALAAFFEHCKVTLDTSLEGGLANPVDYLIEHGYLAKPEFELLNLGKVGNLQSSANAKVSYEAEDQLPVSLTPEHYLKLVAKAVLSLIREGHNRIMVFAASVQLSRQTACVLRALGVFAHSVDAQTEAGIRQRAIEDYKVCVPQPRVLVNYGVLTTGFDAPQTSAVVIARPTRSLVLYSQMVGRAIRGPKAGGNTKAKIITVIDPQVPAFGNIAKAFCHWNDYWKESDSHE